MWEEKLVLSIIIMGCVIYPCIAVMYLYITKKLFKWYKNNTIVKNIFFLFAPPYVFVILSLQIFVIGIKHYLMWVLNIVLLIFAMAFNYFTGLIIKRKFEEKNK